MRETVIHALITWRETLTANRETLFAHPELDPDPDRRMWRLVQDATLEELQEALRRMEQHLRQ